MHDERHSSYASQIRRRQRSEGKSQRLSHGVTVYSACVCVMSNELRKASWLNFRETIGTGKDWSDERVRIWVGTTYITAISSRAQYEISN